MKSQLHTPILNGALFRYYETSIFDAVTTNRDQYTLIQQSTWSRKAHYDFFKNYDDPCFNITANIDVTDLLNKCRRENASFFLYSLFSTIHAINQVDELRLRLINDEVRKYDIIDAGCTVLNPDNTFSFCYFNFSEDLTFFLKEGRQKIKETIEPVISGEEKKLEARENDLNVIHCSSIPWVSFTSFKHAHDSKKNQSIPKIVFGKYFNDSENIKLPVSIEVFHALVDGYHVGQFFQHLQQNVNQV